jgi:hypothetical protein
MADAVVSASHGEGKSRATVRARVLGDDFEQSFGVRLPRLIARITEGEIVAGRFACRVERPPQVPSERMEPE